MANEITVAQRKAIIKPEYTGIQIGGGVSYPPIINILQSDKQYKAFGDAEMTSKMYGKLFVRTDLNSIDDLVDEIGGTAIKIETGHEVRDDSGIIASGSGFLSPEDKEEYTSQGMKPMNMVKVLVALGNAKKVLARTAAYEKKVAQGTASKEDFPFALLVIKGSGWSTWIEVQDKMEELCQKQYSTGYRDAIASLFKFSIKSKKQHSSSFGDYYSFDMGVELNNADEAADFAPLVYKMKDYGLFNKVGERVESDDKAVNAEIVGEIFDEML